MGADQFDVAVGGGASVAAVTAEIRGATQGAWVAALTGDLLDEGIED